MKEKNKKLIILVSVLLLVVASSFAYFVSRLVMTGDGSNVSTTTSANIRGIEMEVNGTLSFTDTDVYPGHTNVSIIEIIAKGDKESIPYNLYWEGTNNINTSLNYKVYRLETKEEVTSECKKKSIMVGATRRLSEECTITNIDSLGEPIYTGTINKDATNVKLTNGEFIEASTGGTTNYYYIVIEYPNLEAEQNEDLGGEFKGVIKAEEANIKILGIKEENESGEYIDIEKIPSKEENKIINKTLSACSNNAEIGWNEKTNTLQINNIGESGTECTLYFEKKLSPSEKTLAKLNITNVKEEISDFSQSAVTDEGVYIADDPMYSDNEVTRSVARTIDVPKSYYFRGAVTNNYVMFANFCWRIVRINGDGSIRLIYDGTTCHANGESTTDSIAVTSQKYNSSNDRSEYVGWTYTTGTQRTTSGTVSNAKSQTESWYSSNITGTNASKVADGKYCNDRNAASGYSWSSKPSSLFYYAGYERLYTNKTPTLSCPSGDVYTIKVGLITADEVVYAGGRYNYGNKSYYLYNGQYYWTMSPYCWNGGDPAFVFLVFYDGRFYYNSVDWTGAGVRPVINLKSDTLFLPGGSGTQSNPYVVQ